MMNCVDTSAVRRFVGQSGDESQPLRLSRSIPLPERQRDEPTDRRRRRSTTELSYVPHSPGVLGLRASQSDKSAYLLDIPFSRHTSSAFTDLPHSSKSRRACSLSLYKFVLTTKLGRNDIHAVHRLGSRAVTVVCFISYNQLLVNNY